MKGYIYCHICGDLIGVIDEVDYVDGKLYFCKECAIKKIMGLEGVDVIEVPKM